MPEIEIVSNGKLEKTSENFRKLFLMKFTLELIRHYKIGEFFTLKKILEKRGKKEKEGPLIEEEREKLIPSIMSKEHFRSMEFMEPKNVFSKFSTKQPRPQPKLPSQSISQSPLTTTQIAPPLRSRPPLVIPEYPLPPNLQYLRPIPRNIKIDLGKLNPIIQDQNVKTIECNGPDENIVVRGNMGSRTTNLIISKEEIDQILQTFSQISKIPVHEGVVKIVVGKLILSAIVSDIVGSKFIIRKMEPQMFPQGMIGPGMMQGQMQSSYGRPPSRFMSR